MFHGFCSENVNVLKTRHKTNTPEAKNGVPPHCLGTRGTLWNTNDKPLGKQITFNTGARNTAQVPPHYFVEATPNICCPPKVLLRKHSFQYAVRAPEDTFACNFLDCERLDFFFFSDCKYLPCIKGLSFLPQDPRRVQPVLRCLFEWIFQSTLIPQTFPQQSGNRLWNYCDSSSQLEATVWAQELFKLSDRSMSSHNFLTGTHNRNSSSFYWGMKEGIWGDQSTRVYNSIKN